MDLTTAASRPLTGLRGASRRVRDRRFGLLLVTPTVLIVLAVVVFPLLWTVLLSLRQLRLFELQRVNLFGAVPTIENYREALASGDFWSTVITTVLYSVFGTAGSILLGLATALSLGRAFRGRILVRGLVLVPYVMPVVASTLLWQTLLNPQYGLVNAVGTRLLGWRAPVSFLSQRYATVNVLGWHAHIPLALSVLIAFEAWKTFPFCYLFILARLQAIPHDLTEAALIDGATPSQRFRYIILPQLRGVLTLLVFLRFIWTFQSFNEIYLLTGGAGHTEVISMRIYQTLVDENDVGGASALGIVMALIMSIALYLYYRAAAREAKA